MIMKVKLIRTATVAMSLDILLKGQLAYLEKKFEVIAVSGEDAHLLKVSIREGVRTVSVPMQRSISPLKDLVSLWNLFLLFKKEKPLIVHSITPKAGLLSMVASKLAGVPIRMHTFTGLIFPTQSGFQKQLLIWMDRLLCFCATNIYPEGEGVKKDLIQYKITNKPLPIIANGNINGIDMDFFNPLLIDTIEKDNQRKELKINTSDFVFLFVGRLVKDKGIHELVAAFVEVHRHNPSCKLVLVGPEEPHLDPIQPTIKDTISTHPAIFAVGYQNDIRPFLAISDAFVFPSYREGFPNVVLQAGAMGLPCVVTDINGSNEIITEGQNGLIIPVKNISALCSAMNRIVANPSQRVRMAANARSMIQSRYAQQFVWDALLSEYQRLEQIVQK
jgi:glycosyltransferase involved in cell wall biosynthesis